MRTPVELCVAFSTEAYERLPGEGPAPLATAQNAVPLIWLGLFGYDDVNILVSGGRPVFDARIPTDEAVRRAEALASAIGEQGTPLAQVAHSLRRAVKRCPEGSSLVLRPADLFGAMEQPAARGYLTQMVHLCEVWERLRSGSEPWSEVRARLEKAWPEAFAAGSDARLARYYWGGTLADDEGDLDEHLVRDGQAEQDSQPQALAVGEQGLLLGRFDGQWKLMSSRTDQDLRGVWGCDEVAFAVGRGGTVVVVQDGVCDRVVVPVSVHLNAVWGLGPRSVCAAGDNGTVLAFNGERWRPWAVPSQANLHTIWGTGLEDITIAGQETNLLRFDGVGWSRAPLPVESVVSTLVGSADRTYAAGGSRRGGELFRRGRAGWVPEDLPATGWVVGSWFGWDELGLVSDAGPALIRRDGCWTSEELPLEHPVAAAGGERSMVVGTCRGYSVIASRSDNGWIVEAAVSGLRLAAVWVAGAPKPPRTPRDAKPLSDARPAGAQGG